MVRRGRKNFYAGEDLVHKRYLSHYEIDSPSVDEG